MMHDTFYIQLAKILSVCKLIAVPFLICTVTTFTFQARHTQPRPGQSYEALWRAGRYAFK